MKRSPLKRKTPLRSHKAKRPIGVREKVARRSGGRCELCWSAKATQMHHRKRRSQGGENSTANLVHLCHECHHVKIHGNPKWARQWGWLLRSTDNAAWIPWGVERTA